MEVRVNIEGHGTYIVDASKVNELISWLTANTVKVNESNVVKEVSEGQETGRELLNG